MKFLCFFVFFLIIQINIQACQYANRSEIRNIVEEEPSLIEFCIGERYYLNENRVCLTKYGIVLASNRRNLELSNVYYDQVGCFILCKKKDVPKEAQEHYDRAGRHVYEGFQHSVGAAFAIPNPFAMMKEIVEGTESWIDAAKEYNAGKECERNHSRGRK